MNPCILLVGGSSEIAIECALIWTRIYKDITIVLIGRDLANLKNSENTLFNNNIDIKVISIALDCMDIEQIKEIAVDISNNYSIKKILFAIGKMDSDNTVKGDKDILEINGISPIIFSQTFIPYLNKETHLIFLSSVASERGRKSNFLYGAGKSMLSTYAEGLQHKYHKKRIYTTLIKLGPTKTSMFYNSNSKALFAAELNLVAKSIIKAVASKKRVVYIPAKWRYIMFVVKNIPSFIFNKIDI